MKRLTGIDAGFLYMETPTMHLHVGGFGIFEPPEEGPPPTYEQVVEMAEQRVHLGPVFRQRLMPVPFGLHHPVLVDDPHFDIRYHVRRLALPAPGGARELAEVVSDVYSRPLDRSKPLWELYFVEGLEGGRFASVTKSHHAIVDGISGVDLAMLFLDLEPRPSVPEEIPEFEPERIPSEWELLGYGLMSRLRTPVGAIKATRSLVRAGLEVVRQQRQPKQPDLSPPPLPFAAPRTSLNCAISPRRAISFATVPLNDLKQVKSAFGCTVNDVVMAVCAGALRRYFDDLGEEVDRPLVAMMPVSVRTDDESGALGNRVTGMSTSLATDIDDPVERLKAIHASNAGAKESIGAVGPEMLNEVADLMIPNLMTQAARLISRTRIADRVRPAFNFTVSNVPGPQFPLYSVGGRMTTMCPLGPVAESSALNITVASYDGEMTFGFQACADAVDDVWRFENATHDALAELLKRT